MLRIKKVLDIVFKQINERDHDTVWAVVGDVGTGKSHLDLNILDYWYTKRNGNVTEQDIEWFSQNLIQFSESLTNADKGQLCILDETDTISNRRIMSANNVVMMQTFQNIRGDNLFTILTNPSLWDLDPYFVKNRIKGLIVVYARGSFAFWSQSRLRKMVDYNQNKKVKKYWVVKPTFYDHFPKYNGILLKQYNKKKKENMKDKRNILALKIKQQEIDSIPRASTMKMRDLEIIEKLRNMPTKEVAKKLEMPTRSVRDIRSRQSAKQKHIYNNQGGAKNE